MTRSAADRRKLWTAAFDDPIVNNPLGWKHRVWLDHILASPSLIEPTSPIKLLRDSGTIDTKDTTSYRASDDFAVSAVIEIS